MREHQDTASRRFAGASDIYPRTGCPVGNCSPIARYQGALNAALGRPAHHPPLRRGPCGRPHARLPHPPGGRRGVTVTQFAARVHAVIARPGAQPEQSGDLATAAETPPTEGAAASRGARAAGLLRRHWLIAMLLAAGLVLRVLTIMAYRPALLYIDTLK